MADAVGCAAAGQVVPDGHYHLDRMLSSALRHGAEVGLCGVCMDARALDESELVEGARRSTLGELGVWTLWADKALVFQRRRRARTALRISGRDDQRVCGCRSARERGCLS
jgi:uncharacterized protein involved in oxidation of intracellular sulfur